MLDTLQGTGGLIGGRVIQGAAGAVDVINPSTEEVVGCVSAVTNDQIIEAIAAARSAFDAGSWSGRPAAERVAVVLRMLDWFAANGAAIKPLIVAEAGVSVSSPAFPAQFDAPLKQTRDLANYYLRLPEFEQNPVPPMERISPSGVFVESLKFHVPVGVVAAISAYNAPFFLNLWKVVPALITGNTMVLRPSPLTPFSALVFLEAARAAGLPNGVLNVVIDAGHEGGVTLTTHPGVDMVTFTGSSIVGERVAAQAARGLKRIQLELGGKSAQIYMPDRVDAAGFSGLSVCTSNAGQGCVLGTRVFVPRERKTEVLAAMKSSIEALTVGDAADPAMQVGPVITPAQRDRCEHYVAAALDAGAKLVAGGKRPAHLPRGYYFEPTVLDLPDNSNPAAQDEIFGPVVGVIGYDSVDHAVEMANDTVFGLSGYVFGKDLRAALAVAQRLRTGTVNVNAMGMNAYASAGGFRSSGIGRERGIEGIRVYQQLQVMNIAN